MILTVLVFLTVFLLTFFGLKKLMKWIDRRVNRFLTLDEFGLAK